MESIPSICTEIIYRSEFDDPVIGAPILDQSHAIAPTRPAKQLRQ